MENIQNDLHENTTNQNTILEVKNLTKFFVSNDNFFRRSQSKIHALENISFSLKSGQTLGLVGESGSGKSTLGKTILKLLPQSSGEIYFNQTNITNFDEKQMRPFRKEMQMIFQDPFANLNPKFSVYKILSEPFEIHGLYPDKNARQKRIQELLQEVGLNPEDTYKFPKEFSGGQKQRIGIARALALKPKFIVCDEPVSALDVSIQSQILNLLMDLREKYSISLLFISHNLAVVEHISDYVAVLHLGQIVELGKTADIFKNPLHPYTKALFASVPKLEVKKRLHVFIQGDVPSPSNPPLGCRFHTRCPYVQPKCKKEPEPILRNISNGLESHFVSCHFINTP